MDMSNRNFIRQGSHASDSTATNSVATLQKNFLNFCLLGAPRVGKSAVLAALEEKPFSFKYFSTINVYEGVIASKVGEQPLSISIKDGPGALQLLTTTQWNALVEDCDGIIYVFDVTNKESLDEIGAYVDKVRVTNTSAKTMLIGNKADDIVYQEIEEMEGRRQAQLMLCDGGYMQVSAKKYFGVKDAVMLLASLCLGLNVEDFSSPRSHISSVSSLFGGSDFSHSPAKPTVSKTIAKAGGSPTNHSSTRISSMGHPNKASSLIMKAPKQKSKKISKYATLARWYVPKADRDTFLLDVRNKLSSGVRVLVYPHLGGSPDYADFRLLYPFTYFTLFRECGQKEVIVIDDMSEVRPYSETSYTFKRMRIPRRCEGKNHLFTLIASEKSISMATDTPAECLFLVKGLKMILECAIPNNVKKMRGKDPFSEERLSKIIKHVGEESIQCDLIEKIKFKLKQGIDVSCVCRNSKYKDRILSLDSTDRRLIFATRREDDIAAKLSVVDSFLMYFEGPPDGMDLNDISEIRPGYTSAKFAKIEPPPDPNQEHLALSFISSEQTIALLLKSQIDRDFICNEFQSWLHACRMSCSIY